MEEVKKMNEKKIVMTVEEVLQFGSPGTPHRKSFDKLQKIASIAGKVQYWSYRVIKKVIYIMKDVEIKRLDLANQFCKKNEKGEPILTGGEYLFLPEQRKLYEAELTQLKPASQKEKDDIAEKYCEVDKKGNPIKSKGNMFSFDPEDAESFNKAFMEVLATEVVLPFDKVIITSEVLEKMQKNIDVKDVLTIGDMILLDKIFDFVE